MKNGSFIGIHCHQHFTERKHHSFEICASYFDVKITGKFSCLTVGGYMYVTASMK